MQELNTKHLRSLDDGNGPKHNIRCHPKPKEFFFNLSGYSTNPKNEEVRLQRRDAIIQEMHA